MKKEKLLKHKKRNTKYQESIKVLCQMFYTNYSNLKFRILNVKSLQINNSYKNKIVLNSIQGAKLYY